MIHPGAMNLKWEQFKRELRSCTCTAARKWDWCSRDAPNLFQLCNRTTEEPRCLSPRAHRIPFLWSKAGIMEAGCSDMSATKSWRTSWMFSSFRRKTRKARLEKVDIVWLCESPTGFAFNQCFSSGVHKRQAEMVHYCDFTGLKRKCRCQNNVCQNLSFSID